MSKVKQLVLLQTQGVSLQLWSQETRQDVIALLALAMEEILQQEFLKEEQKNEQDNE